MFSLRSPSLYVFTAVVAIAVGVLAFLALRDADDGAVTTLTSYEFEASIELVQPQTEDVAQIEDIAHTLKAAYQEPALWRREYLFSSPTLGDYSSINASDGDSVVYYHGRTNSYETIPLPEEFRRFAATIPGGFLIGPLPTQTLDEFLETLPRDQGDFGVTKGGFEDVAGRRAQMVEITPPSGPLTTIWIDLQYNFVLRFKVDDPQQALQVNVTSVSYNQPVAEANLRFEPPPGAVQSEPEPSSGSSSSAITLGTSDIMPPPGFLAPSYLPEGWVTTDGSASGVRPTAFAVKLQPQGQTDAGAPYLTIIQEFRAGGLASVLVTGTPVPINDSTGFATSADGESRLVFARGDIIVSLASNSLTAGELERIAASMR